MKISMKKVIVPIAQKCAGKVNETWPYISADNIHKLVYFEIFFFTLLLRFSLFPPQLNSNFDKIIKGLLSTTRGNKFLCLNEKNGIYVFCYQNCFDLLWEKKCSSDRGKLLKFDAEGQEFAKFKIFENNLFKQWKVRTIFGKRECFFYLSLEVYHT